MFLFWNVLLDYCRQHNTSQDIKNPIKWEYTRFSTEYVTFKPLILQQWTYTILIITKILSQMEWNSMKD